MRGTALLLATALLPAALPAAAQQAHDAPTPALGLERALKSHAYCAKLEFERIEGLAPYTFLFQRVPGAAPQRAAGCAEKLAPVLDGTREVFERLIARPNALAARAGQERFLVIVLPSRKDLESYQRATRAAWHRDVWALHDRALNACVLYDDPAAEERPWLERARAARHVFLHACQLAWYAGSEQPALESWILEGMADALASTGADPAAIRPDADALRQVVGDMQDARLGFAHLRTLAELFTIGEPARLDSFYRTRTPRELAPLKSADNWWAFYRQAALLFGYLWSDESARHRPALVAFLGDALRGLGSAQKFTERFQPSSAAELEQGFLAWVLREHQRAFPLEKVDSQKALLALARGAAAGFSGPLPSLDLSDLGPEERLALAIFQLVTGAEAQASQTLDALAGAQLEADLHERIECERRRLACWRELRDAHLAALAASKATLSFAHEGKTYQARVLAFQDGELVLEKNRSGRERLVPGELDALALAQEMRPQGTAQDWARLVPYALRGDPRTRKLLKDDDGEAGALLRDASQDYPARLRLGRMLARLQALGRAKPPSARGQAEGLLAEVRALRSEGADLDVVQRMEPALLDKARAWLEAEVALLGPPELFGAKFEARANERVCLTYAFDEPRELDDFEASIYPTAVSETLPPLEVADQPFHLADGELRALGRAGLRTRFELAPPLFVHYSIGYGESAASNAPVLFFYLGVADDRAEHFIAGINFRTLLILDEKHTDQVIGKPFPFHLGAVYALEMAHDGEKVFLRCEDREVSIAAGRRKTGALFLRAHSSNPLRLTELVLEGSLTPTTLAVLRKARVERELARF